MEPTIQQGGVKKIRNYQEINQLLQEFDNTSDISVKEFCEMQGIRPATYYNWRKRTRPVAAANSQRSAGFIKLVPSAGGTLFAEVNGIRLYQPVSADYLKSLAL